MSVGILVLAAGRGERLGAGVPKGHVRVAGRSLLQWSAGALGRARGVDGVLPVVGPDSADVVRELGSDWKGPAALLEAVAGGTERQDSVSRGLVGLLQQRPDTEWVAVHDAARCMVTPEDVERVIQAARATGAALLVAPVDDTLKRIEDGRVLATEDRACLARALTPQAFAVGVLREALARADRDGFRGTDCASLVERTGVEVRTCDGRADNFKITTAADLARAEGILEGVLA